MLFLRPLDRSATGLQSASLSLNETQGGLIDGHRCMLVFDQINKLWVDPACGFVVRRWTETHPRGYVTYQIDIEYTQDSGILVPTAWRITKFSPVEHGEHEWITEARIDRWQRNAALKKADFSLVFPPHTRFSDQSSSSDYFVREDGTAVAVSPFEASIRQPGASSATVLAIVLGVTGIAGCVGTACWFWRRGFRSASRHDTR